MKLFFGKGLVIQDNIIKYLELIDTVKKLFLRTFNDYLQKNNIKELMDATQKVHSYESKADDLIRDIEKALYGKTLLPEFRGDIIRLLDRLDKIPNTCQTILFMIGTQNIKIPKVLNEKLKELIRVNIYSIDEVIKLIEILFKNPKDLEEHIKKIDMLESKSDGIERELISKIFASKSIDKCDRLLFKELVLQIGSISDYAENIFDMATIINLKVRV